MPTEQFLQIQVRTQCPLRGVARGAVIVVTTMEIASAFTDVAHGEIHALFEQFTARATPVAQSPSGNIVCSRSG
ncbi:hypothetical protein D3C85_1508430 [compost metagenome]